MVCVSMFGQLRVVNNFFLTTKPFIFVISHQIKVPQTKLIPLVCDYGFKFIKNVTMINTTNTKVKAKTLKIKARTAEAKVGDKGMSPWGSSKPGFDDHVTLNASVQI